MKSTIVAIAVSISTLLTAPAFAGNQEMAGGQQLSAKSSKIDVLNACRSKAANLPAAERTALMTSCSTAIAIQDKKLYCNQDAGCMNRVEAQVQLVLNNLGTVSTNTATAATDFDKTLKESPTAAGAK